MPGIYSPRLLLFLLGDLVLLLALVSPLDFFGDNYLFSAHMLQHMLLILVVPPLLLLGLPDEALPRLRRWAAGRVLEGVANRLPLAWMAGVGTLWIWHLPVLYNAALADERIHVLEHLTFLAGSTLFWWPVVLQRAGPERPPLLLIGYLFAASIANAVLGIMLTFVTPGLYPVYLHPQESAALTQLIRQEWGLDPATDQQAGGLLMWMPSGLIYLLAICGVYARWQAEPEQVIAVAE